VDDTLASTIRRLLRSDGGSGTTIDLLVGDFARFHAVLAVLWSVFLGVVVVATVVMWRRFVRAPRAEGRWWTFERSTYLAFGIGGALLSAFLSLVVAANLSNALDPRSGLRGALGEIPTVRPGTSAAELQQAFATWLLAGDGPMPALIQQRIDDRLAWQAPKAVVCAVLLVAVVVLSLVIWRSLIRRSRVRPRPRRMTFGALTLAGLATVGASFVLMLMVLGNTQAALVPRAMTLVFG